MNTYDALVNVNVSPLPLNRDYKQNIVDAAVAYESASRAGEYHKEIAALYALSMAVTAYLADIDGGTLVISAVTGEQHREKP